MDRRPARDQVERPLVAGVSSILASEDGSRSGASVRFRKAEAQKGRIIDGTGMITPPAYSPARSEPVGGMLPNGSGRRHSDILAAGSRPSLSTAVEVPPGCHRSRAPPNVCPSP